MDAVHSRLRIGRRFRGPPGAANGGFASGSLAALLGGTVDGDPLFPDCSVVLLGQMVAWLLRRDGRKLTAGSALLGPDGEVLAAARTLWVTAARTVGGSG